MLAAYVIVVALMGRDLNRWIVENLQLRLDQAAANGKLQAAVAESKAVLSEIEQIYRYAPVGLCFMDTDHRFLRINEHMAEGCRPARISAAPCAKSSPILPTRS